MTCIYHKIYLIYSLKDYVLAQWTFEILRSPKLFCDCYKRTSRSSKLSRYVCVTLYCKSLGETLCIIIDVWQCGMQNSSPVQSIKLELKAYIGSWILNLKSEMKSWVKNQNRLRTIERGRGRDFYFFPSQTTCLYLMSCLIHDVMPCDSKLGVKCPKIMVGTYIFSSLLISIRIPQPWRSSTDPPHDVGQLEK